LSVVAIQEQENTRGAQLLFRYGENERDSLSLLRKFLLIALRPFVDHERSDRWNDALEVSE
jgi:hypothetical protein